MFGRHPRLPIDVEYEAVNSLEDRTGSDGKEDDEERRLALIVKKMMMRIMESPKPF